MWFPFFWEPSIKKYGIFMLDCFVCLFLAWFFLCIPVMDVYWLQQFSDILLKLLGISLNKQNISVQAAFFYYQLLTLFYLLLTVESHMHFKFCEEEEKQNRTKSVCTYEISSKHWTFFSGVHMNIGPHKEETLHKTWTT